MQTLLISISGPYRSGKTTLGLSLTKELTNAKQYAFADRLKCIACNLHPKKAIDIMADEKTPETRKLLNEIGNSYRVRFGDDVWSRVLLNQIRAEQPHYAIITDTRFSNEFTALANNHAVFLHISEDYSGYDIASSLCNIKHANLTHRPDVSEALAHLY